MASSVNQTVKLPRCRSASLYSAQFVTRRFGRGIWWRRSALYLCGMKARSGAVKQTVPYAIRHICATRWRQYEMLRPALDERARRLFAASHVQVLGRGGIAAVARATGIAPSTIGRGLKELDQGVAADQRLRRPGGGRKRLADTDPSLVSDLLSLIEPAPLGDPERPLLSKSSEKLAAALRAMGHQVSADTVGRRLCRLG